MNASPIVTWATRANAVCHRGGKWSRRTGDEIIIITIIIIIIIIIMRIMKERAVIPLIIVSRSSPSAS
jgi:hypothetical protein